MRQAVLHIPAAISAFRLLSLPGLLWLAQRRARRTWCAALAGLMTLDLLDGMLARRIGDPAALRRQRRLDSLADAPLWLALPVCVARLDRAAPRALLKDEQPAIALVLAAQAASTLACWLKFRRLPRYRTELFRWSAGALGFALAGRVAGGRLGAAFRPVAACLALAHLEALTLTVLLPDYRQPLAGIWRLPAARSADLCHYSTHNGRRDPITVKCHE